MYVNSSFQWLSMYVCNKGHFTVIQFTNLHHNIYEHVCYRLYQFPLNYGKEDISWTCLQRDQWGMVRIVERES